MKRFAKALLAATLLIIGLSVFATSCNEVAEPLSIDQLETPDFQDQGFDTDETPEDTGAVIR